MKKNNIIANLEGASHQVQMTTARAPSSFSDSLRYNSTLQCIRCFGYLLPPNPRGRNVAVPAFVLVSSLVFRPRDLYYPGQFEKKIIRWFIPCKFSKAANEFVWIFPNQTHVHGRLVALSPDGLGELVSDSIKSNINHALPSSGRSHWSLPYLYLSCGWMTPLSMTPPSAETTARVQCATLS